MGKISLQVIGCGDAFASGGQLHTCFYLKIGEKGVLIDCGATTLHGLKRYGIDPEDIDLIVISHLHGDHYGGIPFLLMDAAVKDRKKKLRIVTPDTGEARIKALLQLLYPGSDKTEKLPLEFLEYQANVPLNLGVLRLEAFPVIHSEAALSHGLRIQVGELVLSYSGDTCWTDALISLSEGADLFICECNFYDTKTPSHMNYLELRSNLPRLSMKQILLTHLSGEMLDRLDAIDLPVAKEGMDIPLA
ncbi:MBL fold metallo-hydrolase [Pedobacter sp. GR22-6]|uniref:MBL fold metallo-hydrolase n=1 Tax=Pedobacter sp. GR22-6 TaxID=3127957 RepID=UPI00307FC1A8